MSNLMMTKGKQSSSSATTTLKSYSKSSFKSNMKGSSSNNDSTITKAANVISGSSTTGGGGTMSSFDGLIMKGGEGATRTTATMTTSGVKKSNSKSHTLKKSIGGGGGGGGYLTNLPDTKDNIDTTRSSSDTPSTITTMGGAVDIAAKSFMSPPPNVSGVGASVGGVGGMLKGTSSASNVKKGYFGKSSTTSLKVGGGSGMLKTKVGGDGSSTARPISMSNIMKGGESSQKIIRDGRLDSQSMGFKSMSKPKGGTFLPDLFQSTKKQQEQQQQEQQQTFSRDLPTIKTPVEEEVADINKQEQLAQKLKWLQAPGLETQRLPDSPIQLQQQQQPQQPLRLDPTSPRQQQQQQRAASQFGQTSRRNVGRIGSATRLGSLASFGTIPFQGRNGDQGSGNVVTPASGTTDGAVPSRGMSPMDRSNREQQTSTTTKNISSGTVVGGPTTVGGDGVNDNDGIRSVAQSVTITDPRTGKKRVVRVSNNNLQP